MALKYFCDRCNVLIGDFENKKSIEVYHITVRSEESQTRHGYNQDYDLCSNCFKNFKRFVNNK